MHLPFTSKKEQTEETIKQKENCIKPKHRQSNNRPEWANIASPSPPVRTQADTELRETSNKWLHTGYSSAPPITSSETVPQRQISPNTAQDISRTPTARSVTVRVIAIEREGPARGCRRPQGSRNYEHNNNGQKEKMRYTRIEAIKLSSRVEKTTKREVRLAGSEENSTNAKSRPSANVYRGENLDLHYSSHRLLTSTTSYQLQQ
ncbi:uncharacterized protein LOC132938683 [Metopolophium dirhodum]|uniref:uncharacterized protein LOC132938683 n=1 Tax=Metopolophium dirhodum TaxID=44670 RepID=UPI00298F4884|nr:uncharacterized protein LOC132938683 [Metopolophium dirhodum]XP_060861646.1 uncharacterized protein LOC132938683 [Metopolophium dirhodum]